MGAATKMFFAAGGASAFAVAFLTESFSDADSASYTFSSVGLGAAAGNRWIIVAIASRTVSGGSDPSVTIAGVSATKLASAGVAAGTTTTAHLYAALVPSGGAGNVVVSYANTMLRCHVGIYRVTGWDGSVSGAVEIAGTNQSGAADVTVAGTFAIAVGCYGRTLATLGFSGFSDNYDKIIEALIINGGHGGAGANTWNYSTTELESQWAVCAVGI